MRIVVTGATSQTGSLAGRALAREGHGVRCLIHSDEGRRFLPRSGVEFVRGDLEQPETLAGALEGIDAVAQFAHIRFAPLLIAACEKAGVHRVVFLSSTRRFTKFDCPSARQVREGESAIEAARLDYTILRPSMIYGSRRDNNISRLIAYLRRHRVFPLVGGGKNIVQPVFTLDVVAALLEALKRPATIRAAYTLAGPEPMTYRQMIETIARGLGRHVTFVPVPLGLALWAARSYQALVRRPRLTTEMVQRMAEDRAFDVSAARRDLAFNPVSFEEGLRRQLAGEIDALWAEANLDRK
jgi:nucleoside-diphosphate-sugar epimerase